MLRRRTAFMWVLAAAILAGPSSDGQSANGTATSDQRQLKNLEEEWSSAFVRADITALERILADDFVLTDGGGRVTNKAQEIAGSRDGGLLSNAVSDLLIRVYGNAVVVVGHLTLVAVGAPDKPREYRITDVWIRRGGQWQVVSGHISAIAARK